MATSTQTFETPQVSIVITREDDGSYTRQVTVAGQLAYLLPHHRDPYRDDADSYRRTAQSAICSFLGQIQAEDHRDHRTLVGDTVCTYGDLQDRFGAHYDDLLRAYAASFGADGESIVGIHRAGWRPRCAA